MGVIPGIIDIVRDRGYSVDQLAHQNPKCEYIPDLGAWTVLPDFRQFIMGDRRGSDRTLARDPGRVAIARVSTISTMRRRAGGVRMGHARSGSRHRDEITDRFVHGCGIVPASGIVDTSTDVRTVRGSESITGRVGACGATIPVRTRTRRPGRRVDPDRTPRVRKTRWRVSTPDPAACDSAPVAMVPPARNARIIVVGVGGSECEQTGTNPRSCDVRTGVLQSDALRGQLHARIAGGITNHRDTGGIRIHRLRFARIRQVTEL